MKIRTRMLAVTVASLIPLTLLASCGGDGRQACGHDIHGPVYCQDQPESPAPAPAANEGQSPAPAPTQQYTTVCTGGDPSVVSDWGRVVSTTPITCREVPVSG